MRGRSGSVAYIDDDGGGGIVAKSRRVPTDSSSGQNKTLILILNEAELPNRAGSQH